MANIILENDDVTATINPLVGLSSLVVRGKERLYQSDQQGGVWNAGGINRPDPLIFPNFGGLQTAAELFAGNSNIEFTGEFYLVNGKTFKPKQMVYCYQGQYFSLPGHGLSRAQALNGELKIVDASKTSCLMRVTSTPTTREQYPFDYEHDVEVSLTEDGIIKVQTVRTEDEEMLFSIADHTAFKVDAPIGEYTIVFEGQSGPLWLVLPSGLEVPITNNRLDLNEGLIQNDVTLTFRGYNADVCRLYKSEQLEMVYDTTAANFFIWTADRDNFICLEPANGAYFALNDISGSLKRGTLLTASPEKPFSLTRRIAFPENPEQLGKRVG